MKPSLPRAQFSDFSDTQPQSKLFLASLLVVLVVLLLDLFYVAETVDKPLISQTSLSVFVIFALIATATVAKRAQDESKSMRKAPRKLRDEIRKESQSIAKSLFRQSILECGDTRGPIQVVEQPPPLELSISKVSDSTTEFLDTKGINSNIREWLYEVRKWFSKELIPLVLASHIDNCKLLNSLLRRFTSHKDQFWVYEGSLGQSMVPLTYEEEHYYRKVSITEIQDLMTELGCNYQRDTQTSQSFSLRGHQATEQEHAQMRVQLMETVSQRRLLEGYFKLPGYDARDYAIERLHELVKTSAMSGFSNKSGGGFKGDVWTARYPSDGRLLAHLFFYMLNTGNNLNKDPKFSLFSEVVREFPEPLSKAPQVYFYQKYSASTADTHYDVIVDGQPWPCWSGNDNIFCAVALFLLALKVKTKSYFRAMNCSELMRLIS